MTSMPDDLLFTDSEWQDAYTAAEEVGWYAHEAGGPLAAAVAELYAHEMIGQDEERLWAAITVAGEHSGRFSRAFLEKVIASYRGETEEDLKKLASDYIEEHWPGFPLEVVKDLEEFAHQYAIAEYERCAPGKAGGTLYYFDTNKW